jgi:hypothetical protein
MADNEFVRPRGKIIPLTHEQAIEVAKCADPVNGYKYFLENYFYIQHPTKGQMLYTPYDYQQKMIENMHESRYSVNLCSRQLGKCLNESTVINTRNNITGKTYAIPIRIFYEYTKSQRDGTPGPDISPFETNE